MKISTKLALGFGVMTLMSFIISFYSIKSIIGTKDQIEGLYQHPFVVSNTVREIEKNIISIHRFMKDIVLAKSNEEIEQVTLKINAIESEVYKQFDIIYELYLGNKKDIDVPYNSFKAWKSIREEVITLIMKNERDEAAAITKGKGFEHINELNEKIKVLLNFANNKAQQYYNKSISDVETHLSEMILLAVMSLLMGIIFSVLIIRSIIIPLKQVVEGNQNLSEGKLNNELLIYSKSEMGLLVDSFRQMQKNLSHKADIADAIAAGDFKRKVRVNNEEDRLAISINQIVDTFRDVVNQANRIAKGDFNFIVSKKSSNDELGVALELMAENLSRIVAQTKKIAEGDYTGRLVPSGDKDYMSLAINRMTEKLFEITREFDIQKKRLEEFANELKVSNERLSDAKKKAEESDKLKSAFLANMSHEIRTPMNGIVGFSELLLNPNLSAEEQKKYIDVINSGSQQLLALINDIVDISKIEAGQLEIFKRSVELDKIIWETYAFFTQLALKKGLELRLDIASKNRNLIISTDEIRLKQILYNLLSNAIKYTDSGSVTYGYDIHGNFLEFFVKDTGAGMEPEQANIIFERFQRLDKDASSNKRGAGLGLAITKALVEKLEGKIWIDSTPGKGSIFRFTIFIGSESSIKQTNTKGSKKSLGSIKGKKILVAEDEQINFMFINEILTKLGAVVYRANDGIETVEFFRNGTEIDLVLMDVKMPAMDGYEATKEIKKLKPSVPIIAQTAYAMANDEKKALEEGCDDYISKPIRKNILLEKIGKYLS